MSEPENIRGGTHPTDEARDAGPRPPVMEKAAGTGPAPSAAPGGAPGRAGRFWSARRVPAGVVALLLLLLAGVFLYDIAAVRADRPALAWRRELARQLARRPLDDPWVLTGAAVAAALGLWLLLLAVTPGLRDLLPMRRAHPDVRAALHRDAAAAVLRDRAVEVAGVQSARVRMGRRKAKVRAVAHFREPEEVRADLDSALGDAAQALGLARPPALSVRVARPGRKG
ncbi:membrane protein [Streptomyces cyaneogriseus subsp. noncyanogenus]|uniref:Membrane protein n=1 Tax=Streptomyces cyaneogriseus subsp. noncyanogenus TaxID=477245 RepID=A0A0C5FUL5_9ACTN|nr:membrane protein [Streptomyces cyaneogriseus subsp. noncyanogenus]